MRQTGGRAQDPGVAARSCEQRGYRAGAASRYSPETGVNLLLLLLCPAVLLGLVSGLKLLPGWTGALWPALSIGGGIVLLIQEPEGYDMKGFGLFMGFIAAWCSAVAWLLGRATVVAVAWLHATGAATSATRSTAPSGYLRATGSV
jgi:hypothetical protein